MRQVRTPIERPEVYLTRAELAAAVEITPAYLLRLIRLGVVEPTVMTSDTFTAATAARLRRMLRLHRDLGVNFVGVAIIADLLERLARQERELSRLLEKSEESWIPTV